MYPIISDTQGPCHVFSVYNDALNNVVLIADRDGNIKERPYNQSTYNVGESLEALQADSNLQTAQDDDGWPDSDTTTEQDAIAECQQNADQIFSLENLYKIEAIYGSKFREALEALKESFIHSYDTYEISKDEDEY